MNARVGATTTPPCLARTEACGRAPSRHGAGIRGLRRGAQRRDEGLAMGRSASAAIRGRAGETAARGDPARRPVNHMLALDDIAGLGALVHGAQL